MDAGGRAALLLRHVRHDGACVKRLNGHKLRWHAVFSWKFSYRMSNGQVDVRPLHFGHGRNARPPQVI